MPGIFPKLITVKIVKYINPIDRSDMMWTDIFDKRALIDFNQTFHPTFLWLCKTGIHANVNAVVICPNSQHINLVPNDNWHAIRWWLLSLLPTFFPPECSKNKPNDDFNFNNFNQTYF